MPRETLTLGIEGMHCASCALLVDETLEDLPGIVTARTSVKQARSEVELDPARCSATDIVAAIGELGYIARLMP
ncbi:MAG: heavy-metal-associated domain-containing protein [Pseudonocardia sp.]|jgi:copper chaperone